MTLTDSAMLQKSQAVQILIDAVDATNNGITAVALLQPRMAHLCIREGLQRATHGFELARVPKYKFDVDAPFRSAKAASRFASNKLSTLVNSKDIEGFSIVEQEYPACTCVAVDITTIIPNPSPEVRSLLPAVVWPDCADSANSSSSSSDFMKTPSSERAEGLELQIADPQLDPVYSVLALLPSEVTTIIHQQLRLTGKGTTAG